MQKETFVQYAHSKGWKQLDNRAVGLWLEYPLTASHQKNGTLVIRLPLEGVPAREGLRAVMAGLKELERGWLDPLGAGNGFLQLMVKRKVEGPEQLDQILRKTTDLMREHGMIPPKACPFCGQTGCDSLALTGKGYVPVHRTCIANGARAMEEQDQQNLVSGSYVSGFVGAILGGLVGTLPSLLTILLLERIYVILYALIPLAAFYGYKLLRGKMNKGALICSVISGLLNLFSLNFLVFVIQMVHSYGSLPADYLFLTFFGSMDVILPGMVTDFIFLALGIWICYKRISRTGKSDVAAARLAQESLMAYVPGQGAAQDYDAAPNQEQNPYSRWQ